MHKGRRNGGLVVLTIVHSSGAGSGLKAIATAYWRDFKMQSCVLRQAASLYQRLRSLLAGENLGQHLPVRLVVFPKVSANAALTVVDCDHVGSSVSDVTRTSYASAARPIQS
jgi:hypothetical protein